jgi:hypothetical protein
LLYENQYDTPGQKIDGKRMFRSPRTVVPLMSATLRQQICRPEPSHTGKAEPSRLCR